jgi:hypothetical protein
MGGRDWTVGLPVVGADQNQGREPPPYDRFEEA